MNLHRTFGIGRGFESNTGLFFKGYYYLLDLPIIPEGLRQGCKIENFVGMSSYHYFYNGRTLTTEDFDEAIQTKGSNS